MDEGLTLAFFIPALKGLNILFLQRHEGEGGRGVESSWGLALGLSTGVGATERMAAPGLYRHIPQLNIQLSQDG